MKTVQSDPDCPVFLLEKGEATKIKGKVVGQVKPVAIYVLPHGSINDDPSFVFVLNDPNGDTRVAQLSLAMASPAFAVAKGLTAPPPSRFDKLFIVDPADTVTDANQVKRALHAIDIALSLEQVPRVAAAAAFRVLLSWLEQQGIGCVAENTEESARQEAAKKMEVLKATQATPDETIH